jgi:heme exporter protein C
MKLQWWKIAAIVLLVYTVIGGFLLDVPRLHILNESIRNQYFHVTMWFTMIIVMLVSLIYGIKYLGSQKPEHDIVAEETAKTGVVFGILGIITGSIWAKFAWGAWWVNDAKLNGAAATLLVYFAYLVLRSSIEDREKRARISAVYSIFAYSMMIVFIIILPRTTDSLHPGSGGNPGFNIYDLDSNMRMVFYPAIIGWTLLAVWIAEVRVRIHRLRLKQEEN